MTVVTFAVTWIEILWTRIKALWKKVVTFAVTWIEMSMEGGEVGYTNVVTFAVTWIEIPLPLQSIFQPVSRHLRGDVD